MRIFFFNYPFIKYVNTGLTISILVNCFRSNDVFVLHLLLKRYSFFFFWFCFYVTGCISILFIRNFREKNMINIFEINSSKRRTKLINIFEINCKSRTKLKITSTAWRRRCLRSHPCRSRCCCWTQIYFDPPNLWSVAIQSGFYLFVYLVVC